MARRIGAQRQRQRQAQTAALLARLDAAVARCQHSVALVEQMIREVQQRGRPRWPRPRVNETEEP